MSKTKRGILLGMLGVALLAGGLTCYMYNKTGPDMKNTNATKVAAMELYQSFANDSAGAKIKYLEKILEVSGDVTQVDKNQQGQVIILLKTHTAGASINCTMEDTFGKIKTGGKIKIKGICSGLGQADKDMGISADVYLTRCYLVP